MARHGHPFGGFGKAGVDFVEDIADDAQEQTTGRVSPADGDKNFVVGGVGSDAGSIVDLVAFGLGQHDAAAPVNLLVDFFVGENDKTRNNAAGQNRVIVLKL